MVLIKDMQMPDNCTGCEFLDYDTFDAEMHIGCLITGEIVTWDLDKCRNEKCPLTEVEPYGIDGLLYKEK